MSTRASFKAILAVTLVFVSVAASAGTRKKVPPQSLSRLGHVPAPVPKESGRTAVVASETCDEVIASATVTAQVGGESKTVTVELTSNELANASAKPGKKSRGVVKLEASSTVILDTNVLMRYPLAMHNYPGQRVVIPKQVIRELDNNNHRDNIAPGTKANIRIALRELKSLAKSNGPWSEQHQEIALTDGTGTIVVFDNRDHMALLKTGATNLEKAAATSLDPNHPDDRIIAAAAYYQANKGPKFTGDVALVTGDGVATMSALEVGLNALEHSAEAHYAEDELDGKIYNGRIFADVTEKQYESLVPESEIAKSALEQLLGSKSLRLYPNQFIIFMRPGDREIYRGYVKGDNDGLADDHLVGCYNAEKDIIELIKAYSPGELPVKLNLEQRMAMYAATNPRIRRVIMTGKAGTGKTVVALMAARLQLASAPVKTRDRFDGMVLTKSIEGVGGQEIGFLPGTEEEKMGPVYVSYKDALSFIISREQSGAFKAGPDSGQKLPKEGGNSQTQTTEKAADNFMNSGVVKVANFGFFRGRTFRNQMVIYDEAQNLRPSDMKTLVTRIGEGAKLLVMGDVNQIDVVGFNDRNNGLSDLITRTANSWARNLDEGTAWKPGADQSAVIKMVRSRRSVLVEWTTQLYDEEDN